MNQTHKHGIFDHDIGELMSEELFDVTLETELHTKPQKQILVFHP